MKISIFVFLLCISAGLHEAVSQPAPKQPRIAVAVPSPMPSTSEGGDSKDDPAYKSYKEAYNLILDENWDEAKKRFDELVAKYPKSTYKDDARYWSAYALMHKDKKKAAAAYEKFIEEYPDSRYLDDALADLGRLDAKAPVPGVAWTATTPRPATSAGYGYGYGFGPGMKQMERDLRRLQRRTIHLRTTGTPSAMTMTVPSEDRNLDPEVRLKMDALYALSESPEDEKAFRALKDVAVDMHQARPLREAALDALMEFEKFDVTPVLVEIARHDTSEELQAYAIDYIGGHSKDKDESVVLLIDLYHSVPKQRTNQREAIFYSIAEVGNDKAIDFLADCALKESSYDVRSDAVYLLGNIGGERARSALFEILKVKLK